MIDAEGEFVSIVRRGNPMKRTKKKKKNTKF
jgi:hypothetical protein